MGGKEYTMIFYRRELPENPQSGRIDFHWDFVVYLKGSYHLSNAPARSQFGNMSEVMHLRNVYPSGKYEHLVEKLTTTSMPPEFYLLQEKKGAVLGDVKDADHISQ